MGRLAIRATRDTLEPDRGRRAAARRPADRGDAYVWRWCLVTRTSLMAFLLGVLQLLSLRVAV